jgi:hypothetical protein
MTGGYLMTVVYFVRDFKSSKKICPARVATKSAKGGLPDMRHCMKSDGSFCTPPTSTKDQQGIRRSGLVAAAWQIISLTEWGVI